MGIPYDYRVDLWSLGILCYLLITGYLPINSKDDNETVKKTVEEPIYYPSVIWKGKSNQGKLFVKSKDFFINLLIK